MTKYSVQPRDRIFIIGHEFFPFAENICKNIGKNINKSLRGNRKTREATGVLIGNKSTNKITKFSKNL